MQILVSEISFNKAKDTFEHLNKSQNEFTFTPTPEDEPTLAARVRSENIRGFIADIHPYRDELYAAFPPGSVISRYGVGHDSIDKQKATQNGITVCNTPGVLDNAVAEHAVWMLGALARNIHTSDHSTKDGKWLPRKGIEVANRKVSILGCGRIGRALARKLGLGLDMQVTGYDILESPDFGTNSGFAHYTTDLEHALADADFVITLLPVLDSTRHIANADFFAKMKPGAHFINSARGALVDENALYDSIANYHLTAAALDVFENEPYTPQDLAKDLRKLGDKVLLTPHIGSNTAESNAAMASTAAENIMNFLKTGTCANIVAKP